MQVTTTHTNCSTRGGIVDAQKLEKLVRAASKLAHDTTMTAWETASVTAVLLERALAIEAPTQLQNALLEYTESRRIPFPTTEIPG